MTNRILDLAEAALAADAPPSLGVVARRLRSTLDIGRRRWLAAECWLALDDEARDDFLDVLVASDLRLNVIYESATKTQNVVRPPSFREGENAAE